MKLLYSLLISIFVTTSLFSAISVYSVPFADGTCYKAANATGYERATFSSSFDSSLGDSSTCPNENLPYYWSYGSTGHNCIKYDIAGYNINTGNPYYGDFFDNYNLNSFVCENGQTPSSSCDCNCENGQVTDENGFCVAPPCTAPDGMTSLNASQGECNQANGYYIQNNSKYAELTWQDCDSTCYGVFHSYQTCSEILLKAKQTCNPFENELIFQCLDNLEGGAPNVIKNECVPKVDPCDAIFNNFVNDCPTPPNVITGGCTSNNFKVTSNTLSCDAPDTGDSPCSIARKNLQLACEAPSYIIGGCTDDGNTILNTTLECKTPETSPDGNTSSLSGVDIGNQTEALTAAINQTSQEQLEQLKKINDNTKATENELKTTNTKLDSLIANNKSNSLDNLNSINDLKSALSDKISTSNSKLDDVKNAINALDLNVNVSNNTDMTETNSKLDIMNNLLSDVSMSLEVVNGDFVLSEKENVSNDAVEFFNFLKTRYDNVINQFSALDDIINGGFVNNLPVASVSTCPFNNNLTGFGLTIPVEIDVCKVLSPFYSTLYFIFYILFFGSFLQMTLNILLHSRDL